MRTFLLSAALVGFLSLSVQAQSLQAKRENAVAQWVGVIRRAKTSQGMYSVAALLSQTADQVDAITNASRDWPYRSALHQLEKTAYYKADILDRAEKGRLFSFQTKAFNLGIDMRLKFALRLVRGNLGGSASENPNPSGNKWKLKFPQ